ncbi:MFS transporter [Burkholderia cepacia]|uniref:MFS transporter n=1 Tax=Burkholderia cepacia TaxID=292 RepID=UPI000753D177|nr:MFS transporter [Burkholderia cepacia]KWH46657.1 MFS transporter [Burkholderia cepacia]OUE37754.1 MFS transporter [Burkholderia territorii]HDR9504064.1 MFS transporter [Burkholderia cepacia]
MNTTFAPGGATPGPAAPATDIPTFRSIAAIAAVLLGAIISTLTSRITSLGLADVRGALGVGFDEGAWINTAFTASQMFVGPLAIAAAFVFGTRRVLLAGAAVFLVVESMLPLCTDFGTFIALQSVAGFASGVFVPLTVGFVVRTLPPRLIPFGIAAYAMNLEMSLNLSATLEGWYSEHLSWRWLFWQNALLTVPFIVCLMLSLSNEPVKRFASGIDTRGMVLGAGGFACLCVALDQGERLFWFQSPLIVTLLCVGIVMVAAFLIHELASRSAGLDLSYLARPNIAWLIVLVGLVRFTVLNTSFIPSAFLASTYGLRPLQIGDTLRWIAIPQLLFAPCVAWLLQRVDPRRLIVTGFVMVAFAFALGARLTPVWAEPDFIPSQLLQALGQTMALTSVIFFFGKHVTAEHALTFGAVVQTTRLLSGQLGTTSIAVIQRIMEATHSNLVGLHVTLSDPQTLERLRAGAASLVAHGATFAAGDQATYTLLDRAVRVQATTLALADNFRVAMAFAIAGALIGLLLRPARTP